MLKIPSTRKKKNFTPVPLLTPKLYINSLEAIWKFDIEHPVVPQMDLLKLLLLHCENFFSFPRPKFIFAFFLQKLKSVENLSLTGAGCSATYNDENLLTQTTDLDILTRQILVNVEKCPFSS